MSSADLDELAAFRPNEVLFWSGAGISADSPTRGPLGDSLTFRALDGYFAAGTREVVRSAYRELLAVDEPPVGRPRLETVVDVLHECQGLDSMADLLSDLISPPPNRHHQIFARHLAAGGLHVTANFDTCVERADPVGAPGVRAFHFHGALRSMADVEGLGVTLASIQDGFSQDRAAQLLAYCSQPSVKALVFVGYSGSDYFDVQPFLREHGRAVFGGRMVVWHQWADADLSIGTGMPHPYLRLAAEVGGKILSTTGSLSQLLQLLTRDWNLGDLPDLSDPASPWTQQVRPKADRRRSSTVILLGRLGMRAQALNFRSRGPINLEEHDRLADIFWGVGRYRRARRHWRAAWRAEPGYRWRERQAAVDWIRGRYLRAEHRLWRLLVDLEREGKAESVVRVAETYARVVAQMERLPDIRRRVSAPRRQHAQDLLREDVKGNPQFQAKRQSAWADLARVFNGAELESQSIMFRESEALHGMLNHRQGALRALANKAVEDGRTLPDPASYRELIRQNLVLGARGDAVRIATIPGAGEAFDRGQLLRLLFKVDLTMWHRARLFAVYLVDRARSRQGGSSPIDPPISFADPDN